MVLKRQQKQKKERQNKICTGCFFLALQPRDFFLDPPYFRPRFGLNSDRLVLNAFSTSSYIVRCVCACVFARVTYACRICPCGCWAAARWAACAAAASGSRSAARSLRYV